MAQNIVSSILQVTLSGTVSDTFDLMNPQSTFSINENQSITNGADTNEGNFVFSDLGTIAASGSVTIDLKGSLVDIFGNTVDMDILKVIIVRNTSDQQTGGAITSNLTVATNGIGFLTGTTPLVHVGPGSVFCASDLADGWTLAAGSADTVTIANTNTEAHAAYEFMVMGIITEESSSSDSYSSASSASSSSSSSST